jgi:predicted HicB family RNase H-like nuclease
MVELERMAKFMQSMDDEIHRRLSEIAKARGISIQELIRCVIVPDWLREQGLAKGGA